MNLIVYTASTEGYDTPAEVKFREPGTTYIAFVDDQEAYRRAGWDTRPLVHFSDDPLYEKRRSTRACKALSHLLFPLADVVLWVDGHVHLRMPPYEIIKRCLPAEVEVAAHLHNDRTCPLAEASVVKDRPLDYADVVDRQINHYRKVLPEQKRFLVETGMLLRRNTPAVAAFNMSWWEQICRYSSRDQISFAYAVWQSGVRFGAVEAHTQNSPYVSVKHGHG